MYPIYFAAGFTFGHFFMQYRKNYWAERDAVFRHYIELHPEDFQPPGNVNAKYSWEMNVFAQSAFGIDIGTE